MSSFKVHQVYAACKSKLITTVFLFIVHFIMQRLSDFNDRELLTIIIDYEEFYFCWFERER